MSDLIETFKNGWLKEDPRVIAAALLGIFTFVFLNILLHKSQKNKKVMKQQSIKNRTTIQAKISSQYQSSDYTTYYGRYRYTVNGVVKEYSIHSPYPVPDMITLYPTNKAGTKFFSDYDRTPHAAVAFNALAAIAVTILILWITRYIF